MKTKRPSRSAKKKPAPTVRARATKPTNVRATPKKPAPPAAAAKPAQAAKPAKAPAAAQSDKYRQSGAPWWKQFI